MDISEYGVSSNADPIVRDLVKYDLLKHAVELQAYHSALPPTVNIGFAESPYHIDKHIIFVTKGILTDHRRTAMLVSFWVRFVVRVWRHSR